VSEYLRKKVERIQDLMSAKPGFMSIPFIPAKKIDEAFPSQAQKPTVAAQRPREVGGIPDPKFFSKDYVWSLPVAQATKPGAIFSQAFAAMSNQLLIA